MKRKTRPERVLDPLVQKGDCEISHPISYYFRFNHCGWAIFTVNYTTGEFSIQSDWGNYSYRWNGLSKESLIRFSPEYIADKFSHENKGELERVFDGEKTEEGVIEVVRDRMKGLDIEDRKALGLDLRAVLVFSSDARDFMESIDRTEIARKFLNYEDICTKHSERYRFLVQRLLPFFQAHLKSMGG